MRALRRTLHPVYLWVDAICINQASLPEKGEQVAMMADIYRSAEHVAIWLGDLAFSAAPLARVIWGGWWEAWVDKRVAAAGREKIEDDEKWWRHLLTPGENCSSQFLPDISLGTK
ncbi:heterokaryon incompatibility protein-domain-containing protein [Echria macrotheca]|uniref:Heterokaryon incompatibility protein-domain-containing protein n=1 Tax=Echria macrotheca TaxID=438768 RepID=A0AAJ0FDC9_9PEZI|nr:heterokaryon incompatibility protein-domain-containing protein [Echria macrotheca]